MMSKGALVLAIAKNRWTAVVVSFFILFSVGAKYMFGLYSGTIKTALGYNQETLTMLAFFKDLGASMGIFSGLLNEVTPSWFCILVGAVLNLCGYLMVYLAVCRHISHPPPWQMYLYIWLGANSQNFANTCAVVATVKNIPRSRGILIGLLKSCAGLSGAIFIQLAHAIYGPDNPTAVIFFIGWFPAAVSLLFMFFIRPIPYTEQQNEISLFYKFLYSLLALAGFLLVVIVIQNLYPVSQAGYQGIATITLLMIVGNLAIAWKSEVPKILAPPAAATQTAIITVNVPATPVIITEGKKWWPERGEDFTIPQALLSLDMWVLCIASICGLGSALTAIDNLGQIGESLGYSKVKINTFVSLISIWNFLGRIAAGFLSEIVLQRYGIPRPLATGMVLGIACVAHLLIASGLPGTIYVASVIIGFCFGAQFPLVYATISELFGLRYYATLYNCAGVASPLGAYLLSVRVAGRLYDQEAHRQWVESGAVTGLPATNLTCEGVRCFRVSFYIMAGVSLFGCGVSCFLAFRTRKFYGQDIYSKFQSKEEQQHVAVLKEASPSTI